MLVKLVESYAKLKLLYYSNWQNIYIILVM